MGAKGDVQIKAVGLHFGEYTRPLDSPSVKTRFGIIPAFMSEKTDNAPSKVCPSCGTRMSEDSSRCLVCGYQFTAGAAAAKRKTSTAVPTGATPEVRLSLPIALGLLLLFIVVGGGLTYFGLSQSDRIAVPTGVPTATASPSITPTGTPETPTPTSTPQATLTPLTYNVQNLDTCGSIAFAFNVSVQSLLLENSLRSDCALFIGQVLSVPQPTFTPTPIATSTLSEFNATRAVCTTELYVVQENDTMGLISQSYGIPVDAILEWNGLPSDIVFLGQRITIPFCERVFVGGSTVTPTIAPPYPAAELLLPVDGAPFNVSNNTVTLQWSSVGALRNNEAYQVTVVDITGGQNQRIVDEVVDTSFTVPTTFRPNGGQPHVFRWFVVTVAQIGVDSDGLPVYVTGGPMSESRVFTWSSASGGGAAPTP
ncbi:MAG: LysM peptidoglycan-binding domain-containing protein [Chloroflexi bacterium]|nr:LysM peptidoglycan-binding domain-containing protein [Chloroflexota bacterium]